MWTLSKRAAQLLVLAAFAVACGSGDDTEATVAEPGDITAVEVSPSTSTGPISTTTEGVLYATVEEACFVDGGQEQPAPSPDGYAMLSDAEGSRYCLGPVLLTSVALEAAETDTDELDNHTLLLRFLPGAQGIDRFNAAASLCFSQSDMCPAGQLAMVLDGNVLSAPTINAASFERDQIRISGSFTAEDAEGLTETITASILSNSEALQFRPVILNLGPDPSELDE